MILALEFLTGVFSMFLISYLIARLIEIIFHFDLALDEKKKRTINTETHE
jgi:hypothetical protein